MFAADIEQAVADDPDAAPVLDEAFFKRGGSGYQSRIPIALEPGT